MLILVRGHRVPKGHDARSGRSTRDGDRLGQAAHPLAVRPWRDQPVGGKEEVLNKMNSDLAHCKCTHDNQCDRVRVPPSRSIDLKVGGQGAIAPAILSRRICPNVLLYIPLVAVGGS